LKNKVNIQSSISKLFKKQENSVFFVRGWQRSGTNWLCNLLNLHPKINCVGEFHFDAMDKAFKKLSKQRFGLFSRNNTNFKKNYTNFIRQTIIDYAGHYPLCGDRTPKPIDSVLLPQHKYIYISRDGRDCIVSWMYHCLRREIIKGNKNFDKKLKQFKSNPNYFEENKSELLSMHMFIKGLAKTWNNRIIRDLKTIEKANDLGIEVMHVRYNELIKETDLYRNKMYSFLDLIPEEAEPLNDLTSPGFQDHNPSDHYRIGKNGRWKLYFNKKQHEIFMLEASKAFDLLNLNKDFD